MDEATRITLRQENVRTIRKGIAFRQARITGLKAEIAELKELEEACLADKPRPVNELTSGAKAEADRARRLELPCPEHGVVLADDMTVNRSFEVAVENGALFADHVTDAEGRQWTYCRGNDGQQTYDPWRYAGHLSAAVVAMELAVSNAFYANAQEEGQ